MPKLKQLLICVLFFSFLWANEVNELRGIWITRFEWPDKDPEKCRAKIVRCFENLKKGNFNAAFFQIRGAADVLYPSEIEPWSHLIGGKDPGFDPLQFAIKEAHKHGIQFHAYINPGPMVLWLNGTPPKNKSHIFYKHGPGSKEPWVCIDEDGKIMDAKAAAYYYFSLGIPKAQEYLRNVIRDLVTRYDIDGLHIDRIRYPGSNYSHDKISKRRFSGHGNPNHYDWQNWQREQLNKFINDIYCEVMTIKPKVIVSCAAWGIYSRYHVSGYDGFSSGYHDYYQDSWFWARNGAMDLLVPMIYWDMANPKPNYDELVKDFISGVSKERFLGGQRMYGDAWLVSENVKEIKFSRQVKLPGTVLFSYGSAVEKNAFAKLRKEVYQKPASLPELKNPLSKKTIITGKITNLQGNPIVDAWVTVKTNNGKQTWTSGADGYFGFINVPLGKTIIEVNFHNGHKKSLEIDIKNNGVKKIDIVLNTKKSVVLPIDVWKIHTSSSSCHLLARTNPGNIITVNGKIISVNKNGMFATDNIPLKKGLNELLIKATNKKGEHSERILEVTPVKVLLTKKEIQPNTIFLPITGVAETLNDRVGITHGTHSVRLGGPFLAEVNKGTQLEIVAQEDLFYKVKLADSLYGWVEKKQVILLKNERRPAKGFFTYCNIKGNQEYDIIYVPLKAKIPYSIESQSKNSLVINFYQTHHATTWFSHRNSAKVIGEVTGRQVQEGWYQLHVPIKSKQIWGFWHTRNKSGITFFIKRPPVIQSAKNPLRGLTIALEAGHGGSNTGAIGVSNAKEKDVNRKAVAILQQHLEKKGVNVVLLRYRDTSPSHRERVEKAIAEKADLLVSMHANATGTKRGFTRISGVSTFYKGAHNYSLAKFVYNSVLTLNWNEFGLVGNFNYYPLRNTHFPSVLIEQGFMTNPYDESRLLDKSFQEKQASSIVKGLEEFLLSVKENEKTLK